jgi:outer membrane autotransporter protein
MEYRWGSADLRDEADGETVGARVDAAWRIDAGEAWVIEPQSSLAWTETELDGVEGEAGAVTFGDTTSMVGRLGVRVATRVALAGGIGLQPFAGLHRLREFDGDNVSHIDLGDETLTVQDRALGSWTQLTLGTNVDAGPVQGFVQGEALHGEVSGYAARIGVRLNW